MMHINVLQNVGLKHRCIIIGGGLSVNDYDIHKRPKDLTVIGTNEHYNDIADIIIFYDRNMNKYYGKHDLSDKTILVGHKAKNMDLTERCNFFYEHKDIDFGDTGYHALQFCDKIFNFKEIYLLGFDYTTGDHTYHFSEDVSDKVKMGKFKKHSIGKVLKQIEEYTPEHQVYNCSLTSAIKQFKFKLPEVL